MNHLAQLEAEPTADVGARGSGGGVAALPASRADMQFRVLSLTELSDSQIDAWSSLCSGSAHLNSPFLRPEFALYVAQVRTDARVAVIQHGSGGAAFLPFQQSGGRGRPLGGRVSDFQAVVAGPDFRCQPAELVAGCGLSCWSYDHLVDPGGVFSGWTHATDDSPYIDMSAGFDVYCRELQSRGHREFKETGRKQRKLERELGPVEMTLDEDSQESWEALLQWKSQQYRDSQITDVLARPWVVELLQTLSRSSSNEFRGVMSTLRAGGRLVAVHYGMLSNGVLHYWFPAYCRTHSQYSPGRVLLMELARVAAEAGVTRIDLGRGMSRLKASVMTDVTEVSIGSVELRRLNRAVRTTWRRTRDWLKASPLRRPLRLPARAAYRLREWLEFR